MSGLVTSLYRCNSGILNQKLGLLSALKAKHGDAEAIIKFKTTCGIVGASIGQHLRHSADHIERAIDVALDPDQRSIHYDLRTRGGIDEHDMNAAVERIFMIQSKLNRIVEPTASHTDLMSHRVSTYFHLSGDDDSEYALPSTVARELGFAAHHAIHHLALVRIIAIQTAGLTENDFPGDFGRAPSTLNFERSS